MIASILPAAAAAGEVFGDLPGEPLFPEEEAAITRAVEKRRREFQTVRGCARIALDQLGIARPPLVPGTRGAPGWPAGIIGSMTHCEGYRAAAVARAQQLASLGVDAEPHAPLPDGVLGAVALPEELEHLAGLARRRPDVHWDRLLFSAKESVYKAWFPLAGRWLGFEHARLTIEAAGPEQGSFRAALLVPGPEVAGRPVSVLDGRWTVGRGLVVTAVAVPPS